MSQEHADCLSVAKYLVIWLICFPLNALPSNLATTLPHLKETASQFLLDPSTNPQVISLVQQHGQGPVLGPLFKVSRAWIWSAHRSRMRLLGLEKFLQY